MFAANDIAGSYTVTASSPYGIVSFSLTNTAAGIAATITAVAPASESASVAARYAQPLQVRVLDANGNPVGGASVSFALGAGGGGSGAGASGGAGAASAGASFDGGAAQAAELTNSSGYASSPGFTANTVAGRFTATAAVTGITEPASFSLDNLAGKPPTLAALGRRHRSATVASRYRQPLQVKVTGAHGAPLEGVTVTFSLGASGGGSGASGAAVAGASFAGGAAQATETTDAAGVASSPRFDANASPGTFTATAAVAGVNAVASFSLDNLAGKGPAIRLLGGTQRSATVATTYRKPLEVKVVDAKGKPLEGVTVTFSLGSGGGGAGASGGAAGAGASFTGGAAQATETTDAAGLASSPRFEANATAGAFTATAAVAGITNPASFSLKNLAASAPAITPLGSTGMSSKVASRYRRPLEVKVRDGAGKPLEGVSVTFTLGAGGAGGSGGAGAAASAGASFVGGAAQAIETTDAAGVASSPSFTADTTAGRFTATATVATSTRAASFSLRNLAGAPATVTAGAAANESTTVGTRFTIRLAVTVTDADSNPVAGALVTFSAPAHGPSGSFGRSHKVTARTNASGVAIAPGFRANRSAGGYIVEATAGHARPAAFALVNQPPAG